MASIIPWGLNQQRLRNYLIQEISKKTSKHEKPERMSEKDRREQLGLSFIKKKSKKRQISVLEPTMMPKYNEEELEQIRLFKEWKANQREIETQKQRIAQLEHNLRIKANLSHLSTYIQQQNSVLKRKKPSKMKLLRMKYQQIVQRFNDIQENCEILSSEQEFDIINESICEQQVPWESTPFNEEEKQQINEISLIEQEMSQKVKAVITIQKVWKGYKTRQILQYYRDQLSEDYQIDPINVSAQQCPEPSNMYSSQKHGQIFNPDLLDNFSEISGTNKQDSDFSY